MEITQVFLVKDDGEQIDIDTSCLKTESTSEEDPLARCCFYLTVEFVRSTFFISFSSGNTRGTAPGLVWWACMWKANAAEQIHLCCRIVFGLKAPWQSKFRELRLCLGTSLPVDNHTSWAIVLERKGLITQTAPPLCSRLPDPASAGVGSRRSPSPQPARIVEHSLNFFFFPLVRFKLLITFDMILVLPANPVSTTPRNKETAKKRECFRLFLLIYSLFSLALSSLCCVY